MKNIYNKIIIGVLGATLVISGLILDNTHTQIPPNFIYAQHPNYYYNQMFDYCGQQGESCYPKDDKVCIMQEKEKCTPKICTMNLSTNESKSQEEYEVILREQTTYKEKNQKECILARVKAGDELYLALHTKP